MTSIAFLLPFIFCQIAPDKQTEGKPTELSSMRVQVLAATNKERSAKRLAVLKPSSNLDKAAQSLADDMARRNFFSHTNPDGEGFSERMKKFGLTNLTLAENICKGPKSAEAALKLWMGSEGHRRNILNQELTELGVGYAKGTRGDMYWVQVFSSTQIR